jgi:hypothetical protein
MTPKISQFQVPRVANISVMVCLYFWNVNFRKTGMP